MWLGTQLPITKLAAVACSRSSVRSQGLQIRRKIDLNRSNYQLDHYEPEGLSLVAWLERTSAKQALETTMTKMKTLTVVMMLSAAVATPALAKDITRHDQGFRGAYNSTSSSFEVPQTREERNIQNFGFSGRDRTYPGGWDPCLTGSN